MRKDRDGGVEGVHSVRFASVPVNEVRGKSRCTAADCHIIFVLMFVVDVCCLVVSSIFVLFIVYFFSFP